jgi:hypothetical protein
MNYFINKEGEKEKNKLIQIRRRKRKLILNKFNLGKLFTRGDILTINF